MSWNKISVKILRRVARHRAVALRSLCITVISINVAARATRDRRTIGARGVNPMKGCTYRVDPARTIGVKMVAVGPNFAFPNANQWLYVGKQHLIILQLEGKPLFFNPLRYRGIFISNDWKLQHITKCASMIGFMLLMVHMKVSAISHLKIYALFEKNSRIETDS